MTHNILRKDLKLHITGLDCTVNWTTFINELTKST